MAKKKFIGLMLVLAILVGSLVVACSSAQTESVAPEPAAQEQEGAAALDGQTLLQERCSVCHDLERVTSAKKSSGEWKSTVERMVSKGAKLDAAEIDAVVAYLAQAYP